MIPLSSVVISALAYLGPLGWLQWKKHLVPENLMELSDVHWKNMFYPYIYTDSSSLVNVSPWE